jgi:hypothetical protein
MYMKIASVLESGVYKILHKDPTSQIDRKIWKLLTKHKTVLPAALKYKLTPYSSKPHHLYGLPTIHKTDIPPRPIVGSTDSPCYALADFLHKILSPLVGNTDSFMKNSEHPTSCYLTESCIYSWCCQKLGLYSSEYKGCRTKQSWSHMRHYPSICLEGLRRTMKNLRIASLWTDIWIQDLPHTQQTSYPLACDVQ